MIAKEIWDKARLLFEHGKPLNDIAKEMGINKGSISRKSKQEEWTKNSELATLVSDDVANIIKGNEIATQKATLATDELRLHNREVQDQLRRKNLVFGLAEKALGHIDDALSKTVKDEKGEDTKQLVEHGSKDIKEYVEAIDKASITLNINPRHAPKIDITQNQATAVIIEAKEPDF